MTSVEDMKEMFERWESLNKKVGASFGELDFDTIRKFRAEQRKIEDIIYEIILKSAPEKIKNILPKHCDQMQIGYEINKNKFYYVMIDPKMEEEEDSQLIAITIDPDKNVEMIEDFELEE